MKVIIAYRGLLLFCDNLWKSIIFALEKLEKFVEVFLLLCGQPVKKERRSQDKRLYLVKSAFQGH